MNPKALGASLRSSHEAKQTPLSVGLGHRLHRREQPVSSLAGGEQLHISVPQAKTGCMGSLYFYEIRLTAVESEVFFLRHIYSDFVAS